MNNLETRTVINAKISAFVICVEAIIYLLKHNLHDCTFFFNKSLFLFSSNLQKLNSKFLKNIFFFKKTTKKQTNKEKSYYKDNMHINMLTLFY